MTDPYFSSRRSVRKFQDKEVDSELLDSILERAMKAPNTGNMQLYSVIVTHDKMRRAELAKLHFSQPASTGAPVLLTVCADVHAFGRWCEVSHADCGFRNFLSFTTSFVDAIIYSQQIVTIAEKEGLGTCYLGTVLYNAPEIASLLELPKGVIPVACLAVGWPDGEGVETERLPLEAVMHKETYSPRSDEEVVRLYKEKEEYEPNRGFVAENGKENLAQVFAEVRYPREMNENVSRKLKEYLAENGMI